MQEHSQHTISLFTLPPRFWKWRMRGAALEFKRLIPDPGSYNLVITSSLMSTSDLKSLWGKESPKILLYFHENQFSYPLVPGETRDVQYGWTNILSAVAADKVIFNSHYHYRDFFASLSAFVSLMPDLKPSWCGEEIEKKSMVLYPGCRFDSELPQGIYSRSDRESPLIIWNHRWEHDKNPELFFRTLEALKRRGNLFRIALLGEQFGRVPEIFNEAAEIFRNEIIHTGYVKDREEYLAWLTKGDIVVSTALQENFGIAVVEAIRFGCFPLLPNRLSYPELLPESMAKKCLYSDEADLAGKLELALASRESREITYLQNYVSRFAWEQTIEEYDRVFEKTALSRS